MASVTSRDVLARGFRVLGRAIRDEPRIFAFAVGGSVLFGGLVVGSAYVIGHIVGKIIVPAIEDGAVNNALLWLGALAVLAISVFRVVGIFGRRLGAGYMQFRLQARYRRLVTGRYLDLPLSWHHRHATGTLLSNANSDVEAAWFPIAPLPFAVGTLVMLIGAVGSLFLTDWVLALVGLTTFAGLFLINVFYSRRMAPRQARAQLMRGEVSAIAHESFDGALVVKTMGREGQETDRFAGQARELRDALISVGRLRGLFDPLMETLPSLGTLAVLLVGTFRLRAGDISVTDLVSIAFLFTVLAFPVRAIGWVLAELPRSVAGWDRLQHVLTATGEMRYGTTSPEKADSPARLAFDNVDYAYPLGAETDDMAAAATGEEHGPTVLHDISLVVPEGRTVALVGPTGSGKSTIASLAVRLVDPATGTISIDGHDLPDLTAAALADNAALVAQIPFIFDDSVRANVALDRPGIDDDAVWAALRLAQADEFIARLPEGLDTMVGERGTSLSGGQRQRLTLARALAGRPRLLVLDDATSAVDPRVEAAILAALRGGEQPTSIMVVAYRRATIALADEVVYIEHGRVVAAGTHSELLSTTPGYVDLVTAYERAEAEREREHAYEEGAVTA
ncbi:multidrug ABC transporter ATP-binding protein [Asanoa ishikariensis]|uniref:ABC-type multidrug transport system, ATPase and permease component n=1 Tax=Asanoa ishikariensis TaxID=137265 RepID=A0A1H3P8D1_9ACTN|nr:ABC transporter ATP-binding protein [Asanoa ishikariensis]GIF68029.1 multidrug ABC transporter ATP-binding protein [Asanoa ishikariensis]SDY97382.1 ABC-type multidrug transport system, ATPase and permease component [Asanoa ishikariensis]